MIQTLSIKNFKSIRDIDLTCKRVNVLIGDPNAGKSNILEALAFINYCDSNVNFFPGPELKDFVRFEHISHLFFDFDPSKKIEFEIDSFKVVANVGEDLFRIEAFSGFDSPFLVKLKLDGRPEGTSSSDSKGLIPKIRFYRFNQEFLSKGVTNESTSLDTPYGQNLGPVLLLNKSLRDQIQSLIAGLGYKILFLPYQEKLELFREADEGLSFVVPLSIASDTVRRMIFYLTALQTNKNRTVVIEEPESNTFPLYIKYLAEKMATNLDTQFFVTTHNPYFLQTIIEKTLVDDLSIILVEKEKKTTSVEILKDRNVQEILGLNSDVFLNLDKVKNP